MTRDFREDLKRQLNFIRTSIRLLDGGDVDEALRIAVAVRVIVHDTSRSKSLLAHLDRRDVKLLTTCQTEITRDESIKGNYTQFFSGLGAFSVGGDGVKYHPELDPPVRLYIPALLWWEQVVWVPKPKTYLRRRDLILIAANKVGGAHVDDEIPEGYRAFMDGPLDGVRILTSVSERPKDVHLKAIRVIGQELLESPALREL